MRKLGTLVVLALLLGTATAASAQAPQGQGRGMGGRGMAMLVEGITLTDAQKAKLDSISAKFTALRQEMMADESMDMDARRAKMRDVMSKQQNEIKAMLTDDQKKVFEKNVADMMQRMQGGGQRPQN